VLELKTAHIVVIWTAAFKVVSVEPASTGAIRHGVGFKNLIGDFRTLVGVAGTQRIEDQSSVQSGSSRANDTDVDRLVGAGFVAFKNIGFDTLGKALSLVEDLLLVACDNAFSIIVAIRSWKDGCRSGLHGRLGDERSWISYNRLLVDLWSLYGSPDGVAPVPTSDKLFL
jgi:hypothetical protein